jgi:plasmid stabilization system protein ParE
LKSTGANEGCFTSAALADLDDVLSYTSANYPALLPSIENRILAVLERIEQWPESAREVSERTGVRVVPLIRYPYRIFYRIADERVEILHIHHTARNEVDE